jgi:hypothetical protein
VTNHPRGAICRDKIPPACALHTADARLGRDLGRNNAAPETGELKINSKSGGNGAQQFRSDRPARRNDRNKLTSAPLRPLSMALSVSLRVELLREIEGLNSIDEAALWAQRRLIAKNQLSPADAQQVEEAFATKLRIHPGRKSESCGGYCCS